MSCFFLAWHTSVDEFILIYPSKCSLMSLFIKQLMWRLYNDKDTYLYLGYEDYACNLKTEDYKVMIKHYFQSAYFSLK
jgi:hypothetical protein